MAARDTTGSSDEDGLFECVVCLNDVRNCTGAIWQCPAGHMFCSVCFEQVGGAPAPCPSCQMLLGRTRLRVIENQRDRQLRRATQAPAGAAARSAGAPGPVLSIQEQVLMLAQSLYQAKDVWLGEAAEGPRSGREEQAVEREREKEREREREMQEKEAKEKKAKQREKGKDQKEKQRERERAREREGEGRRRGRRGERGKRRGRGRGRGNERERQSARGGGSRMRTQGRGRNWSNITDVEWEEKKGEEVIRSVKMHQSTACSVFRTLSSPRVLPCHTTSSRNSAEDDDVALKHLRGMPVPCLPVGNVWPVRRKLLADSFLVACSYTQRRNG